MQMGTVPQAAILETIRQIGREVIPYFKSSTPLASGSLRAAPLT